MFKMKGVIPPMVTPFKEDGSLDVDGLKVLVSYLRNEVDGLFVTGSYGSGPMMNVEERKQVVETTLSITQGKIPVIPMVGSTNNRESVELAKHAESLGCEAVAAVGPFYFTHQEDALLDFYGHLIESVNIPVYLYNNPKFQGYPIEISTIKKLKDMGLAGIKDATFDIMTYATYQRKLSDEKFDIALGTEAMFAAARVLGCEAFIPGVGNAFPEICQQMYKEGMEGDMTACVKTQYKINQLREVMYLARSTQLAVYAMMEIRGILIAFPRRPFVPATKEEKEAIRSELINMGLL